MQSYTVQVHLYGSVAVVTLCATHTRPGGEVCLERLVRVLAGLGPGVASLVLDLDCAPYPAPVGVLAAVDRWAAGRSVTVVALTTAHHPGGMRRPGAPAVRATPSGLAQGRVPPPSADDIEPLRQLSRLFGVRVLAHRAAGIRRARHRAHPCP